MLNISSVIGLASDISNFKQFGEMLTRQYDPAAKKLGDVLDELYKMFGALDEEIVAFLSIYFHGGESVIKGRSLLLDLEVGKSRIHINEARGHCHKIANIYEKYLRRWFQDALQPNEADDLKGLFNKLTFADNNMLLASDDVTNWLMEEASDILELIENDDINSANLRIRQARLDVKPARLKITEAMNTLRSLQADLIAATGTV